MKNKTQKILLKLLAIILIILIFGFDKEIISILPYSYIEHPIFQFYLSITPTDAFNTDFVAIILSLILTFSSFILIIIKKNNRKHFLLFSISFFVLSIFSAYITFSRNNYYSVQLKNNYEDEIKHINIDGVRKIQQLEPNEKKWIIYKSRYPNANENNYNTWHQIDYVLKKSRLQIYISSAESMKLIRIPTDNDDPGGVKSIK